MAPFATMLRRGYPSFALPPPAATSFRTAPRCSAPAPSTIITWNVNSLRALLRKDPHAISNLVAQHSADVLCLQETKLQQPHEALFKDLLPGFRPIFNSSSTRLGYSGTVTYTRVPPIIIQREIRHTPGDEEGRYVECVYSGVTIVNVYTVNAGQNLKRLHVRKGWDSAFRKHLRNVRRDGRPVVVVGDLNVARGELDVFDAGVTGAGVTDEERTGFEDLLESCDLVDVYRWKRPQEVQYTFRDYRWKGEKGMRIDYALCSSDMLQAVRDIRILTEVKGSDHCPVLLTLAPGMVA